MNSVITIYLTVFFKCHTRAMHEWYVEVTIWWFGRRQSNRIGEFALTCKMHKSIYYVHMTSHFICEGVMIIIISIHISTHILMILVRRKLFWIQELFWRNFFHSRVLWFCLFVWNVVTSRVKSKYGVQFWE